MDRIRLVEGPFDDFWLSRKFCIKKLKLRSKNSFSGFLFLFVCCAGGVVWDTLGCLTACGISSQGAGIKPASPTLEGGFLTAGSPGEFLVSYSLDIISHCSCQNNHNTLLTFKMNVPELRLTGISICGHSLLDPLFTVTSRASPDGRAFTSQLVASVSQA